MSFSIKCNKCGRSVEELKCESEFSTTKIYYSDNMTLTDEKETITVSSIAGYHGTSELEIKCSCGNET